MAFTFEKTKIPGVVIVQPQVFGDSRGYFMESFKAPDFAKAGLPVNFVQDNESCFLPNIGATHHYARHILTDCYFICNPSGCLGAERSPELIYNRHPCHCLQVSRNSNTDVT